VQRVRAVLQREIDKLFDQFDVVAAAGSNSVAQPLVRAPQPARSGRRGGGAGFVNQKAPDGVSSLCGLPALAVPCGFNKDGLPWALQFIARATNDDAVVAAGRMYQELTDWHRKRPPVS